MGAPGEVGKPASETLLQRANRWSVAHIQTRRKQNDVIEPEIQSYRYVLIYRNKVYEHNEKQ